MTNIHDIVQNIRDRKVEIDTLTYERRRIRSEIVSSVRMKETSTGSAIEDYLLMVTDASYSEQLLQMYQYFERGLRGHENELILTIVRKIPEDNDKVLHEVYRLAVLRSSSFVLSGGRQTDLYFDTDPFHAVSGFQNEKCLHNKFAKVKLTCPDLQMRTEKLSLWNITAYKNMYRRRPSDVAAAEIFIGNDKVRYHMEERGSAYWNVYCAMYRTLNDNTQGVPRRTENVYHLYA